MPYMSLVSVEQLNCVALRLSNTLLNYVLKLHNHGFHCYKTSSREEIIKKQSIRHSKNCRKALPIRMLLPFSACQKYLIDMEKEQKQNPSKV